MSNGNSNTTNKVSIVTEDNKITVINGGDTKLSISSPSSNIELTSQNNTLSINTDGIQNTVVTPEQFVKVVQVSFPPKSINEEYNVITIPHPVTNILQINTSGPQGPTGPSGSQGPAGPAVDTGSLLTTSSFNAFTSSYNTGSFTGSFTGLLFGTASFATTASFALNVPNINTGSLLTTASFNSYTGSSTSQFAGTSSFASTASFALNAGGSGFPFSGSAVITGSLLVSGSGLTVTGSLRVSGSITGSLLGTSSFATTASHALNGGVTAITAGSGISRNNATGNVTITNTAPDQVVTLSNGTSINVTGTYPNFTIDNTGVTSISAGSGISIDQSTGGVTITNTLAAPLKYSVIFSQTDISNPTIDYLISNTISDVKDIEIGFERLDVGVYKVYNVDPNNAPLFNDYLAAVILNAGYVTGVSENYAYQTWYEVDTKPGKDYLLIKVRDLSGIGVDGAFDRAFLDITFYSNK